MGMVGRDAGVTPPDDVRTTPRLTFLALTSSVSRTLGVRGKRAFEARGRVSLVKKVVAHHDLTGIVVGVTRLELPAICEDKILFQCLLNPANHLLTIELACPGI